MRRYGLTNPSWALAVCSAGAAIMLVGLAAGASTAVENPWTGKWSRPAGEFGGSAAGVTTLTQTGSTVTGGYDWHGGGTISGTVSGSILDGTWSEAQGSGTFHLSLAADALSFSGTTEGKTGVFKGLNGSWTDTYIGARPLETTTPATTTKPKRLTVGDLRRNKDYRTFLGLDDERIASSFGWVKLEAQRCSDLVDRAAGFAGVTKEAVIPGQTTSGRHSASIFGDSDLHDLLDSSLPPSDLKNNVFVAATKPYEPELRAAIVSSEGNLQPADVLYLALRATHGSYPLAVLTTLNLLKDVTFAGRDASGYASALVHATPRTVAAIVKEHELYDKEIATLKVQNEVVGKLVSLRQNPLVAQDKMGPWYHAFTILTVGAISPVPIPKGQAAAFWEHFRKGMGAFGKSEAPFNFEKATLDTCFALATDSPGLSTLSR